MKLMKMPTDVLPIEAAEGMTETLGLLIAGLQSGDLFMQSKNQTDYDETVRELTRDCKDFATMHHNWLYDPDADQYKAALDKMQAYINLADKLLKQANTAKTIH